MRERLFKGKREDNGEWLVSDCIMQFESYFGREGFSVKLWAEKEGWVFVIPETVGEYTGLTDKNGSKIFEGDICRFREWANGDMCWIGKVHYEHQQFVISGNKNKECESPFTLVMSRFISENIEVIGNSIDNPELLQNT